MSLVIVLQPGEGTQPLAVSASYTRSHSARAALAPARSFGSPTLHS